MDKEAFDRYLSEQWKWLNKEKKEYSDKKRAQLLADRKIVKDREAYDRKLRKQWTSLRGLDTEYQDAKARVEKSIKRNLPRPRANILQSKIARRASNFRTRKGIVGANKFKARSALGAVLLSTYKSLQETSQGVRPRSDITWRQSVRDKRKQMAITRRTLETQDHYGF